jgi:hypothetical protein
MDLTADIDWRIVLSFIDPEQIDLASEYRKLNQKLFDGELPDVPLRWMTSRRAGGWVRGVHHRDTNTIEITELAISSLMKRNYEDFLGILAHEMVHVYWLAKKVNCGHNLFFKAKLREVEAKAGFKIPLEDDITGLELSDAAKDKRSPRGVILVERVDGLWSMLIFSLGAFQAQYARMKTFAEAYVERREELYKRSHLLESDDPELQKFTAKRSISWSDRLFRCPPALAQNLLTSGKVLDTFTSEQSHVLKVGQQVA